MAGVFAGMAASAMKRNCRVQSLPRRVEIVSKGSMKVEGGAGARRVGIGPNLSQSAGPYAALDKLNLAGRTISRDRQARDHGVAKKRRKP